MNTEIKCDVGNCPKTVEYIVIVNGQSYNVCQEHLRTFTDRIKMNGMPYEVEPIKQG